VLQACRSTQNTEMKGTGEFVTSSRLLDGLEKKKHDLLDCLVRVVVAADQEELGNDPRANNTRTLLLTRRDDAMALIQPGDIIYRVEKDLVSILTVTSTQPPAATFIRRVGDNLAIMSTDLTQLNLDVAEIGVLSAQQFCVSTTGELYKI
jgi:ATP-dependent protease HslVU (ClpYQ) peptidase subunit